MKEASMDSMYDDGFECQIKWLIRFIPPLIKKEVYLRGVDSVEGRMEKKNLQNHPKPNC